jgi:hypothetical protein
MAEGIIPYEEKHWLTYGSDYTVSDITEQDIGGTLTLLAYLPYEAKQLVIRRATPNTQEIDLHNGARLPAELLETMGDKLTMQIQEIMAQALAKDDRSKILQIMNEAIKEAALTVWHEYNEEFQEEKRKNYQSLIDFLIVFIESKFGPLSGSFPLVIESGEYLITEANDYLVVA